MWMWCCWYVPRRVNAAGASSLSISKCSRFVCVCFPRAIEYAMARWHGSRSKSLRWIHHLAFRIDMPNTGTIECVNFYRIEHIYRCSTSVSLGNQRFAIFSFSPSLHAPFNVNSILFYLVRFVCTVHGAQPTNHPVLN